LFVAEAWLSREDEVFAVIKDFVQNLGLDPVECNPTTELRALGIDSLQAVDLVFQLEERLGVQIPMEEFNAKTVGEAIAFVTAISRFGASR
jgi:acyl carrier protein